MSIVLELEQGKLPWLGSVPFLKLLAAELASLPPAITKTIDAPYNAANSMGYTACKRSDSRLA